MKIGIITLNSHANYGGILQAYAMTRVLSNLGHEAKVIYLPVRWSLPWYKYPYVVVKRLIKRAQGEKVRIFNEYYNNKTYGILTQNTQRFIDSYVPHVVVKRYEDLNESDWDAFVVGSDQVWRPDYMGQHNIRHAFLSFASNWNIRRVAYATSFGVDEWLFTDEQTEVFGRLVKKFNAISVREASAVDMCMEHWGVKPLHVIDPTMLLPKEEYESLVKHGDVAKSKGNLLCYILDENESTNKLISLLEEHYSMKAFRVNSKYEDYLAPVKERIQPPVEQWLRGFMDAKMVITDSFHACVFSIIFNKPFLVVENERRGAARIKSLLNKYGLVHRMISCNNKIGKSIFDEEWDWVNSVICESKIIAINYLNSSLNLRK